ncbi:hypothetical protein EON82_20415 [bacterium]|nr:MAG: hypothetical protein EON82_20415 [bacterium]
MKGPDGSHRLRSITAIYVSTTGSPVTARLNVYAGRDPSWFDSRDSHYHLIDFTLGAASQYFGSGSRNNQGVENLLRGFADDAPYPDGFIRFPNINQVDTYGGSGSLTFPTDGGDMTVSILRALSMVSLGVGVVASLALQPEVAIPAFWIAGALAGTAGGVDIYQRFDRGEFEWDLQTGMDLLDIAGAVVSMGASSAASTTIRGVGRFSLRGSIQTGIGVAQIGVMGGVHVAQIAAAVESGDDAAIARAVAHAIADGALILIVHRASARLNEPRPSSSAPETRRTTSGTGSSEPPPRVTETGTPERPGAPQTAHDQWVSDMLRSGMGERPNAPAEPRPIGPEPEIRTGEAAYAEYERTLAETGYEIEVAIYRNRATGEYRVRRGTAMEVSGPMGEGWEGVMHYHPNPGNVLTYRMPAPADINGVALPAFRARAPITEFVEYPLPGGGRGRAAYTLDPRTGGVSIEYQRADGSRYRRSYASLNDYAAEYNARTTYLEPGTPEYEWAMRDLNDYYRNLLGGDSSRRTTGGTTPTSLPTDAALDTMSQAQFDASIDAAFAEAGFNTDHAARPPVRPLGSGGLREGARGRFNAVRDDYATQLGVASGGQVHHAVELQVIDRYPGVYTEAEINGIGNMRGIPPETSGRRQLHNSKIREVWDRHYARLDAEIARRGLTPGTPEYRTVCRRYLDSARDEIDYVMGQFFSEYRRSLFPSPPTSSAPAAPSP